MGSERHTTEVILEKSGALRVTSGIERLAVLKTTKVISSPPPLIFMFQRQKT